MRLRVSSDWDWISTCDSLGQPYRSKCANLGHAVTGDITNLLTFMDPLSSCSMSCHTSAQRKDSSCDCAGGSGVSAVHMSNLLMFTKCSSSASPSQQNGGAVRLRFGMLSLIFTIFDAKHYPNTYVRCRYHLQCLCERLQHAVADQ